MKNSLIYLVMMLTAFELVFYNNGVLLNLLSLGVFSTGAVIVFAKD